MFLGLCVVHYSKAILIEIKYGQTSQGTGTSYCGTIEWGIEYEKNESFWGKIIPKNRIYRNNMAQYGIICNNNSKHNFKTELVFWYVDLISLTWSVLVLSVCHHGNEMSQTYNATTRFILLFHFLCCRY